VGTNDGYDDFGPGLHVLREAEPLKRAGAMAAHMRAELCATLPQAEATLAARSELPPIDVATLTTLQVLARRVARAEGIAARTRDRAATEVGQRLAAGAGLAVHPATIRDRAAAVAGARAAVATAEQAIADHDAEVAAATAEAETGPSQGEVDPQASDARHEVDGGGHPRPTSGKERRSRAIGAIVASFGLVLVLVGLDLAPLWAALLAPLVAALWAMRYLRPHEVSEDDADREAASSLLAEVAASTDERFGARRAVQDLADRTTLLAAARDRAVEDLRVAERAWHELAGEDVDVADVEAVVQRFDPQHEDARLLALETPGVRAAEVVLHQFRQRWSAFWRELGLPAPDAAHGEQAVDELAARLGRPVVLVGPATAHGAELARVAPAAPVVVLHGPSEGDGEG
jgi:hypothetical protein